MSDWGATPTWDYALAGLDQESGAQIDVLMWDAESFTEPLRTALASGALPQERLSEMVRRILRSMYAVGIDRWTAGRPGAQDDAAAHHTIALEGARQGIVLLENDGILPLATERPMRIAVIGGYAEVGVPVGTGSSAVTPPGGYAAEVHIGGPGIMGSARNLYLLASPPLQELGRLMPEAQIEFDPGMTPAEAALLAARSDVVVVFALRVEGEGFDLPDLSLPWGQDAVIDAVASANPDTIVVLETGNPVAMPWREKVRAIVQAWYPGQAGGRAIAEILTGAVSPSGRLPVSFPADLGQTPRPELPGLGTPWGTPTTIDYDEGAEIGYRWFAQRSTTPLYAFGHGHTYTSFDYDGLELDAADTITATFTVTNTGERDGADVPQLYLTSAAGDERMRLLGFERVELGAGASRRVTVTAEPRLLARYDADPGEWHVAAGVYRVAVGRAADDLVLTGHAQLAERRFGS
jgi:beta-glucosidase